MLGVVLCGGQSSRMGTDKGLLKHESVTWAQTAIDKLSLLHLSAVISVNKIQQEIYSSVYPDAILVTDNDSLQLHGPLYGILSVHLQYPQEDLIVLACDMPLIETDLIKELFSQYTLVKTADAFIYASDGEAEPLPGIYKATGLAYICHLYKSGQLHKHSMKYMLEHIAASITPLAEHKKEYFRNFNTHAELNGL